MANLLIRDNIAIPIQYNNTFISLIIVAIFDGVLNESGAEVAIMYVYARLKPTS